MKRILSILCLLTLIFSLVACQDNNSTIDDLQADPQEVVTPEPELHSFVLFEIENIGSFTLELMPEYAPETVANFLKLVNEGFYDGLTFHRIAEDFVIQGGDPKGNGTGQSDETIVGEFSQNGFTQNTLSHTRGVISMARSNDPDSASCQFFIVLSDRASSSLDGRYAAFGRVCDGMDTINAIAALPVVQQDLSLERSKPVDPPVIKSARVVEIVTIID